MIHLLPFAIAIALGSQFKLSCTENGFSITIDPQFLSLVKRTVRHSIALLRSPETKQAALKITRLRSAAVKDAA